MKRFRHGCIWAVLILCSIGFIASPGHADPKPANLWAKLETPKVLLSGVPFTLSISPREHEELSEDLELEILAASSGKELRRYRFSNPDMKKLWTIDGIRIEHGGKAKIQLLHQGKVFVSKQLSVIPGWFSILPTLIAIIIALLLKEVLIALFVGLWIGVMGVQDFSPVRGFLRSIDSYVINEVADQHHGSVMVFTLMLGGFVALLSRSGGAHGLATAFTRFAKNRRRGQLSTWVLGWVIFFDDYANTLLVGTTMRPITDRLRISREKLAFIVDTTSAPIASLALVSTWIGVEIGYIADQFDALHLEGDPYWVFVQSLPYRFYPILILFFGLLLVWMKRDFGPMYKAEMRAIEKGQLLAPGAKPIADLDGKGMEPDPDKPQRWLNAAFPVLVVIAILCIAMYVTGIEGIDAKRSLGESIDTNFRTIVGNASSTKALLWASLVGCILVIFMANVQKLLSFQEALSAWLLGAKSMVLAVIILVLAWALGTVCRELQTAQYIMQLVSAWLHPGMLPALVFAVAGIVSFATGTSWGTMGIMFPLVVPLAYELAPADASIRLATVASVLSGSVWGDHCSPISDTTVMSSLASACDHLDHVRTQVPYVALVGLVSMITGSLGTAMGWYGPWTGVLLGAVVLALFAYFVGKPVDDS
ncbi:MAG: Na+/H+ antiporter NhaC family protein [Myxococcales bacterium]|nr:MAG: Na+/H+ antiporter NhaC family protein [Myxococcales bacterium]